MKSARGQLTAFRGGIDSTMSSVMGFVGPLAALTGASLSLAGAWSGVTRSFANIDDIAKTADKLGLTTEALGGLQHAASLTAGMGDQQFNTALQRMTRRLAEAAMGTGEAKGAIQELGLSAEALAAAGPDRAFLAIADSIRQVKSPSDRLRLAFKLFDSEGAALVNTLNQGSGAIQDMMKEADELGLTFDRFEAAKIEEVNDATTQLSGAFTGLFNTLAVELAPTLTDFVDELTEGVKWIKSGVDGVGELIEFFDSLGINLKAVTIVIGVVIGALGGLAIAFQAVAAAEAFVLALSGPQGWVLLAGGVIAAGAAVAAMNLTLDDTTTKMAKANKHTSDLNNEAFKLDKSMADLEDTTAEVNKRLEEMMKIGDSITQKVRTPVEIFRDEVWQLNDLVNAGALSWETYGRAVEKAKQQLAQASFEKEKSESRSGTAALVRGTTAAFSAVQQANRTARSEAEQRRRDQERNKLLNDIARTSGVIAAKPSQEIIINNRSF